MGVARDATAEQIKIAYRKLARQYHPDMNKEKNAEEKFKELGEAYAVLSDPAKRKEYDQFGQQPFRGQQHAHVEPQDFSDFFSSMFGQRATQHSYAGEDVHAKLTINLEDAFSGSTQTVTLPFSGKTLRVKIPAGVTEGQQIRLNGQGESGGDLYIEIQLARHKLFQVDGADIYLTLPVAPWEVALGATISAPTLAGNVELKIPANSQAGQKLRLRGKGLPAKNPGDQYVVLQVVAPPADSSAMRECYEKMAQVSHFNPRQNLGGAR